jgi:hypothetical protein
MNEIKEKDYVTICDGTLGIHKQPRRAKVLIIVQPYARLRVLAADMARSDRESRECVIKLDLLKKISLQEAIE